MTFSFLSIHVKNIPNGNGKKLRKIIVTLFKVGPDREGGSVRKSKTADLPQFSTSRQEDTFEASDD